MLAQSIRSASPVSSRRRRADGALARRRARRARRSRSRRSRPTGARSRSSPAATSGRCRRRAAKRGSSSRTRRTTRGRSTRPTVRASPSCRRAPATATSMCSRSRPGSSSASPSTTRPTSSTPGRATGSGSTSRAARNDVNGMNDVFRVRVRRRNADGRERRQVHAGVLERAVAGRSEHHRVHRARAHEQRLVAEGAQPHRREPDLARALWRRDADVRSGDEGRVARMRGRCGAPTRRRCTSSPIGAARRTSGRRRPSGASPRSGHDVQGRPPRLADDLLRRQSDRVRAQLRRLDARRGERSRGRGADHAARREPAPRRAAPHARRRASAGSRSRPTERRSRSWRTATCSPRRRRTAATRTRITATPELEEEADLGARQPAPGVRLAARRRRRISSSTTSPRARRRGSPTGADERRVADLVARRAHDRVRARRDAGHA